MWDMARSALARTTRSGATMTVAPPATTRSVTQTTSGNGVVARAANIGSGNMYDGGGGKSGAVASEQAAAYRRANQQRTASKTISLHVVAARRHRRSSARHMA